jgi:hypothetical protein
MSLGKRTGLPKILGEGAFLEVKANFFNAFNNLNLLPFKFFAPNVDSRDFGRAQGALAGRVVELQARFNFEASMRTSEREVSTGSGSDRVNSSIQGVRQHI